MIERKLLLGFELVAVALCLCLTQASPAEAEDLPPVDAQIPWTLELEGDDPSAPYVVYKRIPPGSPYAAYRLEATLDAPPAAVARAARENLLDLDHDASNMRRSIVRNDGDVVIVHSYIDMPPLVTDRDILTRAERSFDPATQAYRLTWSATDEGPAPQEGVIRVAKSDGSWLFEPLEGDRTRVTYESHTEIAGSIPAWIVNSMMNATVVEGFEGLRSRIVRSETD